MVTSVGSVWVGMGKEKRTSCCLSLVYRRILYSFWFQLPLPVKGEDLPYSDTSSSKHPKDTSPYRRRLSTGPIPVPRCRKTSTTLPKIPDVPTTPSISLSVVSSYAESPPPSCTTFAPFYPSSFAPILRLTVPPFFEEAPLLLFIQNFFFFPFASFFSWLVQCPGGHLLNIPRRALFGLLEG